MSLRDGELINALQEMANIKFVTLRLERNLQKVFATLGKKKIVFANRLKNF